MKKKNIAFAFVDNNVLTIKYNSGLRHITHYPDKEIALSRLNGLDILKRSGDLNFNY